jgi:hypothetical protein
MYERCTPAGPLHECRRCADEQDAEKRGGVLAATSVLAATLGELGTFGLSREQIVGAVSHFLDGGEVGVAMAPWEIDPDRDDHRVAVGLAPAMVEIPPAFAETLVHAATRHLVIVADALDHRIEYREVGEYESRADDEQAIDELRSAIAARTQLLNALDHGVAVDPRLLPGPLDYAIDIGAVRDHVGDFESLAERACLLRDLAAWRDAHGLVVEDLDASEDRGVVS